ncbi:hypothetical protein GCM10028807_62980 [Spirosoma daeguense]
MACVTSVDNLDVSNILTNFNINRLGAFSVETFESLIRRVTKQLVEELQNGIGTFLPIDYSFDNEFGSGNLESDLQNFISYINNPSYYPNTETILNRLIYYQIANGFWDRGQRKIYPTNEIKARDVQNRITGLEKIITNELERVRTEKQNLADFVNQKNSELQQIERNLNLSNTNTQQISTLLNQSTANNERISGLLSQQQTRLDESKQFSDEKKVDILQIIKDFETQKAQNDAYVTELNKLEESFQDSLNYIESKKQYFQERNDYLDQLIGREVGASLFETFKQRKVELQSPVTFWKWTVPVMCIITVLWIYFLFKDFSAINDMNQRWQFFALNTLKTIPAILLTYFVVSQYRKERNFQEEYAFKSAVALTIAEYANKLSSPENRDKLIMEAVIGVFVSPIERRMRQAELKSNSLNETLKSIKDGITEVASKVKN